MFYIDYETRSEVELSGDTGVGLDNYASHPTTEILLLAWAIGNEEPQLWFPKDSMPQVLEDAIHNPLMEIVAFNSVFERNITKYKLGIDIPASRFQDPQASARCLSLPASLEDVGRILGLPLDMQKDKRGEYLLNLFSYPHKRKKKDGGGTYFNDKITHPKEWRELSEYAKRDIIAEREIARRLKLLGVFPLPPRERLIWLLDQTVNDRGMPTDMMFVQNLFKIADKNKQEKKAEQNRATGLDNANSPTQLMPWVQERGYPLNNLRKQNIELVLKDSDVKMTEECRNVLEARMEASSTSYKKLQSILRNVSADGRLRNQFIYAGSSRCGRWSGNAVQLHNMSRPDGTFEDLANVSKARDLVYAEDYDSLKTAFRDEKKDKFYSPLIISKNLIRTVFVAPPDKRFNVCDLNAIETRVGAWVAQCQSLLRVFEEGKDPYLDFAVKMTGTPYDKLLYDLKKNIDKVAKAAAKLRRQIAKPAVLGAIYRLGPGGWGKDKNGDRIKTGLWGYAEAMGIEMTLDEAREAVRIFRESYPEICGNGYKDTMKGIWIILENAVADVLRGERTIRYIGPENCIKIDKLTISDRDPMLRIQLPSGRYLHYMDASLQMTKMPWKRKRENEEGEIVEEDDYREAFTYYGMDQETKQWSQIVSHGGKVFENIVQATARDILSEGMLRIEAADMEICGHVHDEIIVLTEDDPFVPGALEMQKLMSEPMSWAFTLPLGAEAWEDGFYHK